MDWPTIWTIRFGDGDVVHITEEDCFRAKILAQKQRLSEGKDYHVIDQRKREWKTIDLKVK